jgi:cell wall-associated NlpC family hydrolase
MPDDAGMARHTHPTRTRAVLRSVLAATAAAAAAVVAVPAPAAVVAVPAPVAAVSDVRWVDVSVATLWNAPRTARPVDAPALADPADLRRWVASMSDSQKRWLSLGRSQTQVLYGTRVLVLATSGRWSQVAVPSQPSPKNGRGYPGWVPNRQLTTAAPPASGTTAVVARRTAWLWADDDSVGTTAGRVMELSYGTRLPVVSAGARTIDVGVLGGGVRTLRRSAVVLRSGPSPVPTGAAVVDEALQFLGLPYLWSGTSGFGFDCSGLTWSAYRQLGITIPRDAAPQAAGGTAVSRRDLRPGDLVFLRTPAGVVHHVGMYVGPVGGVRTVVESPRTGTSVRLTPLWQFGPGYAGARRYLSP